MTWKPYSFSPEKHSAAKDAETALILAVKSLAKAPSPAPEQARTALPCIYHDSASNTWYPILILNDSPVSEASVQTLPSDWTHSLYTFGKDPKATVGQVCDLLNKTLNSAHASLAKCFIYYAPSPYLVVYYPTASSLSLQNGSVIALQAANKKYLYCQRTYYGNSTLVILATGSDYTDKNCQFTVTSQGNQITLTAVDGSYVYPGLNEVLAWGNSSIPAPPQFTVTFLDDDTIALQGHTGLYVIWDGGPTGYCWVTSNADVPDARFKLHIVNPNP